ncbi:MAG: caspase family protein, partial [Acidimicrobiales bacterium]
MNALKRALLVGVDDYVNFNPLAGCVNDVRAIGPLLARDEDGGVGFACVARTAPGEVRRDALLADLDGLLAPGADVAILYFAGHGTGAVSDVSLCTRDGSQQTPGISLSEILGRVATSPVPEVVIILDCC